MYNIATEVISSDKDVNFIGAIAQYAKEDEAIELPSNLQNVSALRIVGITVQSDQLLEYRLLLWRTDEYDNTDLDLDTFHDSIDFPAATGFQIAGANQYYYPAVSPNINLPYSPYKNKIYCSLQNLSAAAKNAGATGEVKITFNVQPLWGG